MAQVQTKAIAPAQPADPFYTIDKLNLFPRLTRALYQAQFGADAPSYDPTRKPKTWMDQLNTAGSDIVTYNFIDTTSKPGAPFENTITMTVEEANSVNLPGVHAWPAEIIPDTPAVEIMAGANAPAPVQKTILCTFDDARALAASWGLLPDTVSDWSLTFGGPEAFQWNGEQRRPWWITLPGRSPVFAQNYISMMEASGVGAPGHWDMSAPLPRWVSQFHATIPVTLEPWPDPVRPLLANEKPFGGLFGGAVIYRTDETSIYNPAPPPPPPAALTSDESSILGQILVNTTKIRADIEALGPTFGVTNA